MLTHLTLSLPAKAVVILMGSYLDWSTPAAAGFRSLADLEDDLSSQVKERALQRYLSDAVRLGLLVITSDPSAHRPTRYRAAVPTGEVVAPAAMLPPDVLSPVDKQVTPARPCRCHPGDTCTAVHPHLHDQTLTPARTDTRSSVDPGKANPTPLPPSSSTDRPLLALVEGNPGGTTQASGDLAEVPIPRHVELVTHGLVAALPYKLSSHVGRRWETRVAKQVARLLAGGWSTDQLVDLVIRPTWQGVVNPGAVLVSRLSALPGQPLATDVDEPDWCGVCDRVDRTRENQVGAVFRCPLCHPAAARAAPF